MIHFDRVWGLRVSCAHAGIHQHKTTSRDVKPYATRGKEVPLLQKHMLPSSLSAKHTDENQQSDAGRPALVAGVIDGQCPTSSCRSNSDQVQLRIRQLAGGMGCQRRPKFRDDADDVLDGWHYG